MSAAEDQAGEVADMPVGVAVDDSVGFGRDFGDVGMVPGTAGSFVHCSRHCHSLRGSSRAEFGTKRMCCGHGPEPAVGENSWGRWARHLALFGSCKRPSRGLRVRNAVLNWRGGGF